MRKRCRIVQKQCLDFGVFFKVLKLKKSRQTVARNDVIKTESSRVMSILDKLSHNTVKKG